MDTLYAIKEYFNANPADGIVLGIFLAWSLEKLVGWLHNSLRGTRYFCVSYSIGILGEGVVGAGVGEIAVDNGRFFSRELFREQVAKSLVEQNEAVTKDNIVINGFYEFKSKRDYDNFCSGRK